jgi:hypothetical protein
MLKLMMAAMIAITMALPGVSMAQPYSYPGYAPYPYSHSREYRHHHQARPDVDCHSLREACLHKRELGEQGEGNCARYRELCRR